ncbi:hypothetical protein [Maricaulis parjimensis]|uniref:hypothetical protein n=1 Tax=Maricaulis parjimensis TaxID=144023 RepID=UPI00193A5A08|nr:hypothetical protein [Maricaulis parjimensis]
MRKLAVLLIATAAVSACEHSQSRRPQPPQNQAAGPARPMRPPMQDTVQPAIDMCMVETLAEQRLAMLEEVHGYREAIGSTASSRANVADTETQELIAAFETDLDASYRFATASCRTYNRCLQVNRFEEASCQDTASLWHDSQDRFHDLSERLSLVRERIASDCQSCGPRRSGPSQPAPERRRHTHESDDLMGSVFSTGGDGH